jgi:hypothetical protein
MHNQYGNTKQYWENEIFLFMFDACFHLQIISPSILSTEVILATLFFGDCLWLAKSMDNSINIIDFFPVTLEEMEKNSIHTKTLAVRIRMYFHFGKESIEDRAQNQLFLFFLESHTICCKRVNSKTNMHDPHHLGSQ